MSSQKDVQGPGADNMSDMDTPATHSPSAVKVDEEVGLGIKLDDTALFAIADRLADAAHVDKHLMRLAAQVANEPASYQYLDLTAEQKTLLEKEKSHRWKQPWSLFFVATVGALAAAVQGMDETVVNGAQLLYQEHFGITNSWLLGLVNGSPFLACAFIGCWLSVPLSLIGGRKGGIFIGALIGVVGSIIEAVAPSWHVLLVGRLILGVSIGSVSAIVPVYSSECAPVSIRGALTMLWQLFTAFGIMMGYIIDLAFRDIGKNLDWRLMLGSTFVPGAFVAFLVIFSPESPRYLMKKQKYAAAYRSLKRLRNSELQAARDLFVYDVSGEEDRKRMEATGESAVQTLIGTRRGRNACVGAGICMFMQQFCGVNIIMYYSSLIFVQAGISVNTAIVFSLVAGIINFVFAFPALVVIDRWGRRPLLLTTFPAMGATLIYTGCGFLAASQKVRLGIIASGIYLYMALYSPGMGPVPFTYSAEAFPNSARELGMSFATSLCWFFSFVLALILPAQVTAFTSLGVFCWYGGWCFVGFFLVFFFCPETKGLELEELDAVFNVPLSKFALHQFACLGHGIKRLFGSKAPAPAFDEKYLSGPFSGPDTAKSAPQIRQLDEKGGDGESPEGSPRP